MGFLRFVVELVGFPEFLGFAVGFLGFPEGL